MIPVYQTIFDKKHGNCWAACMASILELPLSAVPNFMDFEDFNGKCDEFLSTHNLYSIAFSVEQSTVTPQGYHIIVGDSPRHDCLHAVVGRNGNIVHDPYPGSEGLKQKLFYEVFITRNPAQVIHNNIPISVMDWMQDSLNWYRERSHTAQTKIDMAAHIAFRRCFTALQTGKPGPLPIGLEVRRRILKRKFTKPSQA